MGQAPTSESGSKRRKLHVYENVRWGDLTAGPLSTGVYMSKKANRKLFELPPDREDELTEREKCFSGMQLWDLNAFRKDRLRDLVIDMPWEPQRTSHDPFAPDPKTGTRTKKQQFQLEEMRRDRDEFVKTVCDLANRGGPTDLISACKIAIDRRPQSVPDIRALPKLENVVKTAAKYMNREELYHLIHGIRRNDQVVQQKKTLYDDDVEVVELFANGTCAYGHFRGGDLSRIETMSEREMERQRKSQASSSSSWLFSKGKQGETKVLLSSSTSSSHNKVENKREHKKVLKHEKKSQDSKSNSEFEDTSSSVVGCRIGTGTWRLREDTTQNDIFVRPTIELRFARDHYWSFELTTADMEERVRVQWRPTNPPRNVLMRATTIDQQNSSTILKSKTRDIRIVMKPNFMGALREKWIRWPSLKRVKRAQRTEAQALKIASTEYKKVKPKKSKLSWLPGFGKSRDDEDEDEYSTSNSSNKGKRNDTKRSGEQKDSEIDRKTSESAIELYMACTTGNTEVVRRLVEHSNLSALVRFRYGWDGRNNTPVHQAALYGHAHVMELFMKRVQRGDILASDLFVVNNDQNTPLHLAVSRLNVECTEEHINQRSNNTGTKHILIALTRGGRRGAKQSSNDSFSKFTESKNKQGMTALRMVMERQAKSTDFSTVNKCSDILWMLCRDLHWQQSLVRSIRTGDEAGCMTAIDNGAKSNGDGDPFRPMNMYDRNVEPSLVTTPLHVAAMSSHSSVIELLLMYISKEYEKGGGGGTTSLGSHGSGGNHSTSSSSSSSTAGPEAAKHEAIFRALNARNEKLATPLHLAAQVGSVSCCKLLIEHGAVLDAQDQNGETPLHYCVKNLTKTSSEVAELLLSLRANVWIRSNGGDEEYDVRYSSSKEEDDVHGGKYALDSLPSISKCSERGAEIFQEREKVMDLLRAHMGLPETDAEPPAEMVAGTQVEVRLPIGNGEKGAWRLAWIENVHRSTAQGMLHSYDDDPNVYKTLDRDLVIHQIAPASTISQDIFQNQWKPCVIESIRKRKGRVDRDLSVIFLDHTKRTVRESEVRLKRPKSIQRILDSDEEEEEKEGEEENRKRKSGQKSDVLCVGDRCFVKPVKFDLILRCSFPGCAWHVATPSERRDPVMFSYMVSRLHAHEMRSHVNNAASGGITGASSSNEFKTSFVLTVVNGTDITTLKKRVAPSTFVEVLFVDRRFRLANGSLRVLRRFCTKVNHDTDSPLWNQRFEVKNITSTALQLQLILWEDTKKGSVPTKSKCLGNVTYNLSSIMKGGESKSKGGGSGIKHFMPRIGHGSSNLEHSQIISIPWLHTSRILPGEPTGFDTSDSNKNRNGMSTLTFSLGALAKVM